MISLNNFWQTNKTIISFSIMGLILLFVGLNQTWTLVLGIINLSLISAVMAMGVNIQWGYAGLFNVGILGFAALGGVSVVLISQQPVAAAVEVGGLKMLIALFMGIVTVVTGVLLNRKGFNKWAIAGVVIFGYLITRHYFSEVPSKMSVSVDRIISAVRAMCFSNIVRALSASRDNTASRRSRCSAIKSRDSKL